MKAKHLLLSTIIVAVIAGAIGFIAFQNEINEITSLLNGVDARSIESAANDVSADDIDYAANQAKEVTSDNIVEQGEHGAAMASETISDFIPVILVAIGSFIIAVLIFSVILSKIMP